MPDRTDLVEHVVAGPSLPDAPTASRFRPTVSGRGVVASAAVLLVAALVTGYGELFGLAIACALALGSAGLQLVRRPQLAVHREITPVRVARGGAAVGLLEVANAGRFRSPAVQAVDLLGRRRDVVRVPGLARGEAWRTTYALDTSRRGAYLVGPLTLEQRDVLGLLERVRGLGAATPLWVHPVVLPLAAPPGALARDLAGPEASSAIEGSIAFSGLREYQPGDDRRQIHWRSSARAGHLVVRTHVDTSRPDVLLLLDDRDASYPDPEVFEEAVSLVASIAVSTIRAGFTARVELVSRRPFAQGEATALLDGLAAVEPVVGDRRSPATVSVAAQEAGYRTGGSCAVTVLGPAAAAEVAATAPLLRRWRTVVAAVLTDGQLSARTAGIEVLVGTDAVALGAEWEHRRWR